MRFALLIAIVLAGAAVGACGQKGQLYLPSQKKSKVPPTQQQQQAQPPDAPPPTTPPPQSTTAPS